MKKALVTGCSGLVGTFLIKKMLLSKEYSQVVGVDMKPFPISMDDKISKNFIYINE